MMTPNFNVNGYFNDLFAKQGIFAKRDVLWPTFVPPVLLHRDDEIRKIAEIVGYALRDSTPANAFVYGRTGTGKTAVVRYVRRALNENCRLNGVKEPCWVYVNCGEVNTTYRILAHLHNAVADHVERENPSLRFERIPFTGLPTDVVFERFVRLLDGYLGRATCFVVLDEVDVLARKNGNDVLYMLSRVNEVEKLKNARVSLIGISNVLEFKSDLDPRVASSLLEEELVFPAYNSRQLKDILSDRAGKAFRAGACPEEVVALCAALAAKEHGDARKALDLLRRAGEVAERENATRISERHVWKAQKCKSEGKVKEYLRKLPAQMKTLLLALYLLTKNGVKDVKSGDLYFTYKEVARLIPGTSVLTPRRVSDLVNEMSTNGVISAQLVSRGRGGRFKIISLATPGELLAKVFSKEVRLRDLLDYVPRLARRVGAERPVRVNDGLYRPLA
ncbi:MAG: Cdc6/Cdc18 family protein [Promethearchaeota archaeon]